MIFLEDDLAKKVAGYLSEYLSIRIERYNALPEGERSSQLRLAEQLDIEKLARDSLCFHDSVQNGGTEPSKDERQVATRQEKEIAEDADMF